MSNIQEIESLFRDWLGEVSKDLKKRGAFWTPTLVSGHQEARTVVLRSLEKSENSPCPQFIVHTDIRSQKWQELQKNNNLSLHFYCPKRKWQMRLKGKAYLHHGDPEAQIEWRRLSLGSQQIYGQMFTPGEEVETPQTGYTFEKDQDFAKNFGVLRIDPISLESLQLSHPMRESHHIRAAWLIEQGIFKYLAP
jgi:pyridoxamine 5'-phosphate oxidase